jgi:hypothetical protein
MKSKNKKSRRSAIEGGIRINVGKECGIIFAFICLLEAKLLWAEIYSGRKFGKLSLTDLKVGKGAGVRESPLLQRNNTGGTQGAKGIDEWCFRIFEELESRH